MADKMAAMTKF